jgi:nitroreductase
MRRETLKKELLDLMKSRRSIRKYREDPVPLEKIYKIMKTGRCAPSGANMQPWIYILVTDNKLKEEIRKEAEGVERNFHKRAPSQLKKWFKEQKITPEKSFLTEAPVLIVMAGFTKSPYWLESTWIFIAYILLYAESQGLRSLTHTPSDTTFLDKLLNIPEVYRPVAVLPIGYPAERSSAETRPRKPLEEIANQNRYGIKLKP